MPESPTPNVFGYNGEATDYETGLQYLRARYYDTDVQRFVQEDDYRGSYTSPISMNRYAYAHSNPVMGVDPSGYARTSALLLDGETLVRPYANQTTKVIKPEYLIPGLAGYLDGAYCNDGGAELMYELMDEGKTWEEAKAIVDSRFVPMSESEVNERNAMMDIAYEYINYTWTPTQDLTGWKDRYTYEAGVEYTGVPYSQANRYTVEQFDNALTADNFYLTYESSSGKVMPRYGQDCSGLFSDVWGNVDSDGEIVNLSTLDIIGIINLDSEYHKNITTRETSIEIQSIGDYNKSDFSPSDVTNETSDELIQYYDQAAPGDAVVKRIGNKGHVMIIVANDGNSVTVIEQTEPTTQLTTYTYQELADDQYLPITKKDIEND